VAAQHLHCHELAEIRSREIDSLMVLLKLLFSQELHAIDEKTVNYGYVFLVKEAIDKWLDNQDVHARFSQLIRGVRILDNSQQQPSDSMYVVVDLRLRVQIRDRYVSCTYGLPYAIEASIRSRRVVIWHQRLLFFSTPR
jgi:hypothetical protein